MRKRVEPFFASDFMLDDKRLVYTFKRDNCFNPSIKQEVEEKLEKINVRLDDN